MPSEAAKREPETQTEVKVDKGNMVHDPKEHGYEAKTVFR